MKCLSNDDEINELIRREIDCRTRFIICDSKNARASKWVQSEIDYVKSRGRKYEIIDLDASDDEIYNKLDKVIKQSKTYICYSRNDYDFVQSVIAHLRKYEMRLFWNVQEDFGMALNDKLSCMHVQTDNPDHYIKESISSSERILLFASKRFFLSDYCTHELSLIDKNKPVNVLWLDDYRPESIFAHINNTDLFKIENQIDLSGINVMTAKIDAAIEAILNWSMSCQDVYVMAENFRKGYDGTKDIKESKRLYGIAYRMAKKSVEEGDKEAILILARCEAKGFGTEKDLEQALLDYQRYVKYCKGDNALQAEINAVRKKFNNTL